MQHIFRPYLSVFEIEVSSLQSEHLGVVAGLLAFALPQQYEGWLADQHRWASSEVMAAIAVHNIPEGIAIAMPAASQDIDIECIERLHEPNMLWHWQMANMSIHLNTNSIPQGDNRDRWQL